MLCGFLVFKCCILKYLVASVILTYSCTCLSDPCQLFYAIKITPWFQTAGFGVFAGRAFKKDEVVIRSWMTLFLPKNLPEGLSIWYYCFGHNETHVAIPLDYGSLLNHQKSANTYARPDPDNNMHFQVQGLFQMCKSQRAQKNIYMRACIHVRIFAKHTSTKMACILITFSRP